MHTIKETMKIAVLRKIAPSKALGWYLDEIISAKLIKHVPVAVLLDEVEQAAVEFYGKTSSYPSGFSSTEYPLLKNSVLVHWHHLTFQVYLQKGRKTSDPLIYKDDKVAVSLV